MNNISLHFNDYEEISKKNAYLVLKYKCCCAQVQGILELYFCNNFYF